MVEGLLSRGPFGLLVVYAIPMKRRPHESPDCKCAPCREWETTQSLFDLRCGAPSIEMILELLNLDPEEVRRCWLNGSAHDMSQEEQTITVNWHITM